MRTTQRRQTTKIAATFVTALIIGILISAGPAESYVLSFSIAKETVKQGEEVSVDMQAEVESNEILAVRNFSVLISGQGKNVECSFSPNGSLLSTCSGVNISLISLPSTSEILCGGYGYGSSQCGYGYKYDGPNPSYGYGYGYGYGPGFLKYRITVDTNLFPAGVYDIKFISVLPDQIKTSSIKQFTVTTNPTPLPLPKVCSIRARNGDLEFKNITYTNARLNMFAANNNGKHGKTINGQGNLVFTADRNHRFTYKFKVLNETRIDSNTIVFKTTGKIDNHTLRGLLENATITYNTQTKEVAVNGMHITASDLGVTFSRC